MTESEERPLVGRIAGDDEAGFADFYRRYAQILFNFAVRTLRSPREAEDAVMEIFLAAWRIVAHPPDSHRDHYDPLADHLLERMRDLLIFRRRRDRPAGGSVGCEAHQVDLEKLAKNYILRVRPDGAMPLPFGNIGSAVCTAITKCGTVSAAVLSHVYFGCLSIGETARALSMSPSECRSRLHRSLEMIASRCGLDRPAGHEGDFAVYSSAHALGALDPTECPEYLEHLAGGCRDCAAEISRFSGAAGRLALLLPDMNLPGDLSDKILFTFRLAQVVSGSQTSPRDNQPEKTEEVTVEQNLIENSPVVKDIIPEGGIKAGVPRRMGRTGLAVAIALGAAVLIVACGVVIHSSSLRDTIDSQYNLIESVQTSNTELLLKYDRLAGASGFFESRGLVTILEGNETYPGLAGKIVWDTNGNNAMLQILNLPASLEKTELVVNAVCDGEGERVAGFHTEEGDSGRVLYRYFPVDFGGASAAREFTVAAAGGTESSGRTYRKIMSGTIPNGP